MEIFHNVKRVYVEQIHERLREELANLGLSAAEAARLIGETSSQGLRDILGGRKRLPAELLASLAEKTGVDALYILMGTRASTAQSVKPVSEALTPRERALLDNYRHTPVSRQRFIEEAALVASERQAAQGGGRK